MTDNKIHKYQILKVKDKKDNFYKNKGLLPNLPFRTIISGRSHVCGKSNLALNLMLLPEFYNDDFIGDNIFIISDNLTDNKIKILKRQKDIPNVNILNYDSEKLEALYEYLEDEYNNSINDKKNPPNILIYLDDVGYSGKMKTTSKESKIINKIFCNSRHINVSVLMCIQSIMQLSSTARKNCSCAILMNLATKQEMESMERSYNHLPTKQQFINMYLDNTKEKHSFLSVVYDNDYDKMYLDKYFEPIDVNKYSKTNLLKKD